jgi:hypothetical protein
MARSHLVKSISRTAQPVSEFLALIDLDQFILKSVSSVRFGSKADIGSAKQHVRFTPESDIKCDVWECPLRANGGHRKRGE